MEPPSIISHEEMHQFYMTLFNLIFRYDPDYEKVEKINRLLDTLKAEGKL